MKRIAIFASGGGSNAERILDYFEDRSDVSIALVVSNKKKAGVIDHAITYDVPTLNVNRSYFYDRECIIEVLKAERIDFIVLAGFLWLIPKYLIQSFPDRIINIHPALLPAYGGKGMYGHHVHTAVKSNGDSQSGMTIHFVNEKFDDGAHIFQAKCQLLPTDTANQIATKVLLLEHTYYPSVIDHIVTGADLPK